MPAKHRQTSTGRVVGLAIAAVLLLILPGIALAALVLTTVMLSPALRRDSRMLAASGIAVLATLGGRVASIMS